MRVFPGDEMLNPVSVTHKSHIPEIMVLTLLAREEFRWKVGIRRIYKEKVCDRTTLYHRCGDVYIRDWTLDAVNIWLERILWTECLTK